MHLGNFLSLLLALGVCSAKDGKPEGRVNVTVSLHMTTANFDEQTRTLSGMIWLNVMWTDERFASSEPVEMRHVPPTEIWKPDITFFHSPFSAEPADLTISNNGLVMWVPKVSYSETCVEASVRYFPWDSYVCRLVLGSWTYGQSEISLAIGESHPSMLSPLQENAVWEISVKDTVLYEKIYSSMPNEIYPKALFDFELKRKCSSLGIVMVFPAIMTALMTVAMFLLPAECREKVTFGAIIFLSLILIMKDLPSVLPKGGVTAISCYYAVNLALVSVALFVHCCLVLLSYPANSSVRPPKLVRKFSSCFSAYSCFANERLELDESNEDDAEMSNSAKGARNIAEWRFVARMIDRLLLLIFIILLILMGLLSMAMAEENRVKPNL